jgi:hypothetical protein
MPDVKLILEAIAAAAGLAAAILLACGWPWKMPWPKLVAAGWAIGVGNGFFVGCLLLGLKPRWPPQEGVDRLLFLLLPATIVVEILGAIVSRPRWLAWALRAAIAVAAGRILLHGSVYLVPSSVPVDPASPGSHAWSLSETWLYLGGMAAGLAVVWILLERLATRSLSRVVPHALALACGAAGVTIMLSGYATGGQMGFPLSGAIGAAALASLVSPKLGESAGAIGVGVVMLFAMLVLGRFFGDLTTPHAVLLFFAPLLAWVGELPLSKKLRSWQRGLLQLLVVAIPLAIVVVQAQRQFAADSKSADPASDPYSSYYK